MEPGGKGSLQTAKLTFRRNCNVQSLHKGIVRHSVHSLDSLILTTLGVTVCPIVHSPSIFASCRGAGPIRRPSFQQVMIRP
jgi:hypothetical protein